MEALLHQHRVKEKAHEEIATRQWRVSEGQILVYDPGPMWNATRFLIAGVSLAFYLRDSELNTVLRPCVDDSFDDSVGDIRR